MGFRFFTFSNFLSQVMQLCPIHILHSSSVTSLDAGDETTPTREPTPINIEEDLTLMLHDSVTMVIQALCGPMETLLSKLTKHDPMQRRVPQLVDDDGQSLYMSIVWLKNTFALLCEKLL